MLFMRSAPGSLEHLREMSFQYLGPFCILVTFENVLSRILSRSWYSMVLVSVLELKDLGLVLVLKF